MKSKGYAKGGKKKQGYNARLDESLGMRKGKRVYQIPKHEVS